MSGAQLRYNVAFYEVFFEALNELRTSRVMIETWDAGWWQIRKAMTEQGFGQVVLATIKDAHDALREKLLPQVEKFGFLG